MTRRLMLLLGLLASASTALAQISTLSQPPGVTAAAVAGKANLAGGNSFTGDQTIGGSIIIPPNSSGELLIGRYSSGVNALIAPDGTAPGLGLRSPDNTDRIVISNTAVTLSNPLLFGAVTSINASGVLQAAAFPALTGDVTTSAGSLATTIAASSVTTAKMANLASVSLLGNPTGGAAAPSAVTLAGGLGFSGSTLTAAGALTPTSVASSGAITSSGTTGVGYATGAGGTITQVTGRTTTVTLNKLCGAITLISAAGSATAASFSVSNSLVAATDVVIVNQKSGTDKYLISVTNVAAAGFQITSQTTGGTTTESPVFNFCVIKGVAA